MDCEGDGIFMHPVVTVLDAHVRVEVSQPKLFFQPEHQTRTTVVRACRSSAAEPTHVSARGPKGGANRGCV